MGLHWVDDGHTFPLKHPEDVAQVVDDFAQRLSAQPVRS
jgi:hypothetical protein